MSSDYPILEYDGEREAILEPSQVLEPIDIPERCVLPMYERVIDRLRQASRLCHIHDIYSSMRPLPVYRLEHGPKNIAVVHPGLGAPFAAAVLEELIAFGCRKFIACGSAGVLDATLSKGTVVVPSSAVRDEGTSYHYIPPAREIEADPKVVSVIASVLQENAIEFRIGKTWTTDAIYRETRGRIARRKAEGCLTAEMECSALLAVAAFRGVALGQLLATADDLSGEEWDLRDSRDEVIFPETVFWLSVEACLRL
jgi:uridine phosphorylase